MSKIIYIVGIDPALRNTGLALARYDIEHGEWAIEEVSLIQTENQSGKTVRQSSDDYRCARETRMGINAFAKRGHASFACAEVPSGAQSARAAFSNGLCCGVLAGVDLPLIQVSPKEVKVATGNASASKEQMIAWASGKWPNAGWKLRKLKGEFVMTNDNEHMADACGAVAAGVVTSQFYQAMAIAGSVKSVG